MPKIQEAVHKAFVQNMHEWLRDYRPSHLKPKRRLDILSH